jgi:hypothetical protein
MYFEVQNLISEFLLHYLKRGFTAVYFCCLQEAYVFILMANLCCSFFHHIILFRLRIIERNIVQMNKIFTV